MTFSYSKREAAGRLDLGAGWLEPGGRRSSPSWSVPEPAGTQRKPRVGHRGRLAPGSTCYSDPGPATESL